MLTDYVNIEHMKNAIITCTVKWILNKVKVSMIYQ